MKIETILNDAEKLKVNSFLSDTVMANAIKKILLLGIYENGTIKAGEDYDATTNFALGLAFRGKEAGRTNEEIGADLRACAEGIRLLEGAYQQLEKFKVVPEVVGKKEINKAR